MNAAKLENSPRLQRVLSLLSDGREYSTRDIQQLAHVCGSRDAVAELRDPLNGFSISCHQESRGLFIYQLLNPKEARKRLDALGVTRLQGTVVRGHVRGVAKEKPEVNLSLF